MHSLINIADEVASHLKTANLKIGHRSSTAAVINKINKSVTNRINNLSDYQEAKGLTNRVSKLSIRESSLCGMLCDHILFH